MKFDDVQKTVTSLLAEQNYLGAWATIKHSDLNEKETQVLYGAVAANLVTSLQRSRLRGEDEQVKYLRSTMVFVLKDFPALSGIYRESIDPHVSPFTKTAEQAWQGVTEAVTETAKSSGIPVDQLVSSVQNMLSNLLNPADTPSKSANQPAIPIQIIKDKDSKSDKT